MSDHNDQNKLRSVVVPISDIEIRESGAGEGQTTIRGHAAVFDRLSHDLGGFRERIARGAFADVLDRDPDVHLVWDHDTSLTLARTKNKTLELREDPMGLHVWARVAPTSYAQDLRVLMDRGDIDQMSFAFTVEPEDYEWRMDDAGEDVIATVRRVSHLFDVTVTAQGAYPQTDVSLVRSLFEAAKTEGRIHGWAPDPAVAPLGADGTDEAAPEQAGLEPVGMAGLTRRLQIARRRTPHL